jgi:hypothetical protein
MFVNRKILNYPPNPDLNENSNRIWYCDVLLWFLEVVLGGGLLSFGWYDGFLSLAEHGGLELACMIKHKIGYLLGFLGIKLGGHHVHGNTPCDPPRCMSRVCFFRETGGGMPLLRLN